MPPHASAAGLGTTPARRASHSAGLAPRSASLIFNNIPSYNKILTIFPASHRYTDAVSVALGGRGEAGDHSRDKTVFPAMSRVRALIIASHPGPSLAITAMATLLAAEAAPHGIGPVLMAPAMLAGQLSVGWSNDACDARRDAAAGRTDKPVAAGAISVRAVWIAAFVLAAGRAGDVAGHQRGHRCSSSRCSSAPAWAYNARPEVDAGIRPHVPHSGSARYRRTRRARCRVTPRRRGR